MNSRIIITPYLKFSTPIYELFKAVSKKVKLSFIYGKTDLQFGQDKLVKDLDCDILYKENLHAKCYLNEQTALICSMNLHAYSEVNNYEMGVLLEAKIDRKAYDECKNEINLIILNAQHIRLLKREEIEKKELIEYDRTNFSTAWIEYLKTTINGVKYKEADNSITFFDYPTKNVNLTTNYGIISIEIQLPYEKCKSIREKIYSESIFTITGNYRLFWNNPYNKIHLYWGKKITFNSLGDEFDYCKKGFLEFIETISKIRFA